jgi:hypothetical protein
VVINLYFCRLYIYHSSWTDYIPVENLETVILKIKNEEEWIKYYGMVEPCPWCWVRYQASLLV